MFGQSKKLTPKKSTHDSICEVTFMQRSAHSLYLNVNGISEIQTTIHADSFNFKDITTEHKK